MPYKNPEDRRANRTKWRLNHPEENKKGQADWRAKNKPALAAYNRKNTFALKLEMIEAYGGKCACCGQDIPEFLTLDHPNGDGAEDRRQRKTNGGYGMYLQLKREGWPKTFRLLCWDCNCSIGRYGYCPHQSQRPL